MSSLTSPGNWRARLVMLAVLVCAWPSPALPVDLLPVEALYFGTTYPRKIGQPQLNDNGFVVWSEKIGSYDQLVVKSPAKKLPFQITTDPNHNRNPQINNSGLVVWSKQSPVDGSSEIYTCTLKGDVYFPGPLSANGKHNEGPQVNDAGDIAWFSYNLAITPYGPLFSDWQVHLYQAATTKTLVLDSQGYIPVEVDLNNKGQVAWIGKKAKARDAGYDYGVLLWKDGTTSVLATNPYEISHIHLNEAQQLVWQAFDGNDYEIFQYYNHTSQTTTNTVDDLNPVLNNHGCYAWQQFDGKDYEVFYKDMSLISPPYFKLSGVTSIDFNIDEEPQINDSYQIVWKSRDTLEQEHLFIVYDYKLNKIEQKYFHYNNIPADPSTYNPSSCRLSNSGQIVWSGKTPQGNDEVYLLTPYIAYDFTYYFNNGTGDYYSGYWYDSVFAGYVWGKPYFARTDENGQPGYYYIQKSTSSRPAGGAHFVYATSYYDYEAGKSFKPILKSHMDGLGSEWGYIIREVEPWFWAANPYEFGKIGGKMLEADSRQSRYSFKYTYSSASGDYYLGYLYAPEGLFGLNQVLTNEPKELGGAALTHGTYKITAIQPGFDYTNAYKLVVTDYYDATKAKALLKVNTDGASNPGSVAVERLYQREKGYAIKDDAEDDFSPYQEADVFGKFRFLVMGDSQSDFAINFALEYLLNAGKPTNTDVLDEIVKKALSLNPRPDLVVFAGDVGNWGANGTSLAWGDWSNSMKPLKAAGIDYHVAIGNHELYEIDTVGDLTLEYDPSPPNDDGEIRAAAAAAFWWLFILNPFDPFNPGVLLGSAAATSYCLDAYKEATNGAAHEYASDYALKDDSARWLQSQFEKHFNPLYYSFEWGNSLFTILDSFYIDPKTHEVFNEKISSNQIAYLQSVSAYTKKTHKFAISHSPPYKINDSEYTPDTTLWTEIDKYDYDIFFSAHEHLYHRLVIDSSIFPAAKNNVTQIITGGAGAPFENTGNDGLLTKGKLLEEVHHYLIVDVDGEKVTTTATGMYKKDDGWLHVPIDTFQVNQEDPPGKTYTKYEFIYHYNNAAGDRYSGFVYAPTGHLGYQPGYKKLMLDENNQTGYYEIISATNLGQDKSKDGQVYVTSYYDKETNRVLTPQKNGTAAGGSYLGSEYDYIIQTGVPEYFFGGGKMEADLSTHIYYYKFDYRNGDSFTGKVYAPPEKSYNKYFVKTVADAKGIAGFYTITGEDTRLDAVGRAGQVYVDNYHDGETDADIRPVNYGRAVGTNYLGSEADYIFRAGVPAYRFSGAAAAAANVYDTYNFIYRYGNGDSYQGVFYYSSRGTQYYPSWKSTPKLNETGKAGYYEITKASYTGMTGKYGQVFITSYYDGESKKSYKPLKNGQPAGTANLGSEQDYIVKDGVAAYRFGKGYDEADVGDKYLFRYYYTNGDYYTGSVYQAPSATGYYPGQKIYKTNELGLKGYYEILSATWTGETAKYKQVFVDSYKDGESGKTPVPLKKGTAVGTASLGSELDYIVKAGVATYKFGQGYYEADVGDKYLFRYYYTNGDYYTGSVYQAPSATGYYPGQKIYKTNELGLNGYYQIISATWTGETAKYKQVFVTQYYDGDRATPKLFTPVNSTSPLGNALLGSEAGYIPATGIPAHYFGEGYYEADE